VRTAVSSWGVRVRDGCGCDIDDDDGPISSVSAVSGMTIMELQLELETAEERTPLTRRLTFSM
jgi:hypothetical protein